MKQNFELLYRIGKAEKEFSKLKPVNKSGKEDEIQKFFEENLTKIFPKLKLFVFEKNGKKTTKHNFKGGQLDAIGWNSQGRFFIIFEYKSQNLPLIVEQIVRYLDVFSDEDGEVCRDLIDDFLNKKFPKSEGLIWKHKEIEWKMLKLIWIAPNLPYKKNWIPRTTWVKSGWYESDDGEKAVKLESEDEERLLEQLSNETKKKEKPKEVEIPKKEIEDLSQLLGEIKPLKEVEEWSKKIHKIAMEEFSLNLEINPNPRWRWLFYKRDNQTLFWNFISKKKFTIYFANVEENKFLTKKWALQETPTIFKWVVNNEESFAKAAVILRDLWQQIKLKK
ncbi:MAG: hypothetical protein I3273_05945 [Candidatus Moeniiplasma glomeromycotorum]|nr:hypothetical protein [Candidatus Moeniiplasma glomeromycotorum]MCE8168064.1 hypothetical protein [Candidatus Moeniiplasma glomeromycotorum]MCE8169627.1 hypothetical protein [Candidatus Moeniiplasma glomeromycotorum]